MAGGRGSISAIPGSQGGRGCRRAWCAAGYPPTPQGEKRIRGPDRELVRGPAGLLAQLTLPAVATHNEVAQPDDDGADHENQVERHGSTPPSTGVRPRISRRLPSRT